MDSLGAEWLFLNTGTIRLVDVGGDVNRFVAETLGVTGGVFLVNSSKSYTTRLITRSGKI